MAASILERLNARIAAEPALTSLDTLFVDLQDARDYISGASKTNSELANQLVLANDRVKLSQIATPVEAPSVIRTEPELLILLRDARQRLTVNALSDVGYRLDRAIKLLEG